MNPIFSNSLNPLREHMVQQETKRRQNSIIWYSLIFFLGFIVCYLVMRSQTSFRTKEEDT
jgi:glucose-6-phosphate-specific signal transduction histidine kinase